MIGAGRVNHNDMTTDFNLKNYTSDVPYERTISRIESYLAQCGVTGISKQYEGCIPAALYFHVDLGKEGRFTVRLPAKVEEAQQAMYEDYMKGALRPRRSRADFREQAARTAWKIQEDWVRVQMSLIKLKQVDFLQVFMGFVWNGKQTYYDQIKDSGLKLLGTGHEER